MQDDEPTVAGVEGAGAPGGAAESSDVVHPAVPDAGERNWFAWMALSAVAVALATIIFALRPDAEPTATGTDTTIVERDGDTTRDSTTSVPSTSVAPTNSIELAPDEPADSFERRPFDEIITGAVAYNGGWLANGSRGLVWSANGLDWGSFETGISQWQLHDWSLVDGELLLVAALPISTGADAVRSADDDAPAQEVEYSVWRVEANGELSRAAEYGIHRDDWDRWRFGGGTGASFGVLLSQDVEDRTRRGQIADDLSPWLTPDELVQTCRVVRAAVETADDSDGFVNAVEFRDCEEETIAIVLTDDLGGDSTNELLGCLNSFVNPVVTQSRFIRFDRNVPPAIEQFEPGKEVLNALATPDGSLVFSSGRSSRSGACDTSAQATTPKLSLELWPTSGLPVEIDVSFLDRESFRPFLLGRSDGSAVLQTNLAVYRLAPGSREFEKFVTTPFAGSPISYAVDDRFFAQSGSTGAISDSEGAWTTFDLGSPKRAGFVLAGKDFVVVEVAAVDGRELVKIPFERSSA